MTYSCECHGECSLVHAELEEQAMAALLQESEGDQQPRRAPKAGRRAVKQLELLDPIDGLALERLGGPGTECSICRSFPASFFLCNYEMTDVH